jgi:hypothetical protein
VSSWRACSLRRGRLWRRCRLASILFGQACLAAAAGAPWTCPVTIMARRCVLYLADSSKLNWPDAGTLGLAPVLLYCGRLCTFAQSCTTRSSAEMEFKRRGCPDAQQGPGMPLLGVVAGVQSLAHQCCRRGAWGCASRPPHHALHSQYTCWLKFEFTSHPWLRVGTTAGCRQPFSHCSPPRLPVVRGQGPRGVLPTLRLPPLPSDGLPL